MAAPSGGAGAGGGEPRESIRVVCRFRPLNKIELSKGTKCSVTSMTEDTVNLTTADNNNYTFAFDRIYGTSSSQVEVYDYAAKPILDALFKGYNGCLLAYGQTGAGKTHTMMGAGSGAGFADDGLKGIIPRAVDAIFDTALKADSSMEYSIKVSFVEIYCERIRDLFEPKSDNLTVGEDPATGIYIKGVTEYFVTSQEEVMALMAKGNDNRATAATGMNAGSSRSHSMFMITLTQKNVATSEATHGKLYLVDLAGSETVSKTGVSGQQLEELKKINKSLSSLGNVINALTDGKSSHIPYRDSKLTRVLQECIGGNAKTTLIINCSPSSWNEMETLSTLRFGKRAKRIVNRAVANKERSPEEMKRYIALLEAICHEAVRVHKSWTGSVSSGQLASVEGAGGVVLQAPPLDLAALVEATNAAIMSTIVALEAGGTGTPPAPTLESAPPAGSGAGVEVGSGSGGGGDEEGQGGGRRSSMDADLPGTDDGRGGGEEGGKAGADGVVGAGMDAAAGMGAGVEEGAGSSADAGAGAGEKVVSSPDVEDLERQNEQLLELLQEAQRELQRLAAVERDLPRLYEAEREVARLREFETRVTQLSDALEEKEERITNLASLLTEAQCHIASLRKDVAEAGGRDRSLSHAASFVDVPSPASGAAAPPSPTSVPGGAAATSVSIPVVGEEEGTPLEGGTTPTAPAPLTPGAGGDAAVAVDAGELDLLRQNYHTALSENEELRAELADLRAKLSAQHESSDEEGDGEGEGGVTASIPSLGVEMSDKAAAPSTTAPVTSAQVYEVVWEHQCRVGAAGGWAPTPTTRPGGGEGTSQPPPWAAAGCLPGGDVPAGAADRSSNPSLREAHAASFDKFSSCLLPSPWWTAGVSWLARGREEASLPSTEWYWRGDWMVDNTLDDAALVAAGVDWYPADRVTSTSTPTHRDGEGWSYAPSWDAMSSGAGHSMGGSGDAVRRRRWVRLRSRINVTAAESSSAVFAEMTRRLEVQDAMMAKMAAEISAKGDTIARLNSNVVDYEARIHDLYDRMANAAATGDLRFIGQGRVSMNVGIHGSRIVAGPGAHTAGARTLRGGGSGAGTSSMSTPSHGGSTPSSGQGGGGAGGAGSPSTSSGWFDMSGLWKRWSSPGSGTPPPSTAPSAGGGLVASPLRPGGGMASGGATPLKPAPSASAVTPPGAAGTVDPGVPTGQAFCDACEAGQLDAVAAGLALPPPSTGIRPFMWQDAAERTPLLYAARGGQVAVLERLVAAGATLAESDKDGRNALHYAARRGHTKAVQWLLERGMSANSADVHALTPLHQATLGGSVGVMELLLKAGADLHARDANGSTPLKLAKRYEKSSGGNVGPLKLLESWLASTSSGTAAPMGDDPAPAAT